MNRRVAVTAGLAAVALASTATVAIAAWRSNGTGSAYSQAVSVNRGVAPTASLSGTTANVVWNAATLSNGTTSVTSYVVKRYANGSTTGSTLSCRGVAGTGAQAGTYSCADGDLAEGSYTYTDTPKYSNWTGAESAKSAAVVIDTTAPTAPTISQPVGGTTYATTAATRPQPQTAWPGSFAGSPGTDSGSGVARVEIQLSYTSGHGSNAVPNYWNGTTWTTTAAWVSAGTTWSYPWAPSAFPVPNTQYTVTARTVDNAGNVSTTSPSVSFTFNS